MKKHLLTILTILMAISSFANPIDEATAKRYAENFWKENRIMGIRNGKVFKKKAEEARFVNIATRGGYSEFYIFNNELGKGFVIVSADDCVTPILGYSYENNFVVENMPDNVKGWMDGYAEQIRYAVNARLTATDEIREEWRCLQECKHLPIKSERAVNPLITTTWGQGDYYNALCPNNIIYGRTPTGCVATAMAQIMKYHNYPSHGYGFHSYRCFPYGVQSADFGNTIYQWTSMPNSLSGPNNAVATLMYHCGVSVEMNYGYQGSSARTTAFNDDGSYNEYCAENALKNFFGYNANLHGIRKVDYQYQESQWIAILKSELDAHRPILYDGYSTADGGHAFVCDGYNNYNEFHFNWGWDGAGNESGNSGYFIINTLNPTVQEHTYNFSSRQGAIIGIEPDAELETFDLMLRQNVQMSSNEYDFCDDEISAYIEVLNHGNSAFDGYIGAAVFSEISDEQFEFIDFLGIWNDTSDPLQPNYYNYGDINTNGGIPYIPGSYEVAIVYSMDGNYWYFVNQNGHSNGHFDVVNSAEIETQSDFNLVLDDCLHTGENAIVNVDLKNAGNETFYGNFGVLLQDMDGYIAQEIGTIACTNGLQPNYHYTNGLDFSGLITVEPGFYYLTLVYQHESSTGWYYAGASDYPNPVYVYVDESQIVEDQYEPNNSVGQAYSIPVIFNDNFASIVISEANLHSENDVDFYKYVLPVGYDYFINTRLYDSFNNGNMGEFSLDGKFAYSTDGTNWSDFYDDESPDFAEIYDGGVLYIKVLPYFEGSIGTYLLGSAITRTDHTVYITVSESPSYGGHAYGGGAFWIGETCYLHAEPNTNYTFTNWTENGTQVSTNPNYSFTVTADRTLVANFTYSPVMYTINATASPTVGGTINGTGQYASGETCTLTAMPNPDYIFTNWTENGTQVSTNASYSFAVTSNRNLTAIFTYSPNVFMVTAVANPSNGGVVSGAGNFEAGQTCTLNASANTGFTFVNWTENGTQVSANTSYSFTVTANRNLVANFPQSVHTITATAGANGTINPSGAVSVAQGGSQTFEMIPNSGYEVFEVYVDGNLVGSMSSFTFNNVVADHSIFAIFQHVDGVGENMNNEMVIYPNPTNGILNVQCPDMDEMRVFNVYGVLVAKQKTNGNNMIQIDLSGISSGVYLLQAIRNNESVSKVFIKE